MQRMDGLDNVDDPQSIIDTFYRTNASPESALDMIKVLESTSDSILFSKARLDQLVTDVMIFPYLCALFASNTSIHKESASRRRVNTYYHAIYFIKSGGQIDSQRNECIERLAANAKLLSEQNAVSVLSSILDNFMPTNESSLRGHIALLELIPSLFSVCSMSGKASTLENLFTLPWPNKCIAMLSSLVVELSEGEEQCNQALEKVSSHIGWNLGSLSSIQQPSENSHMSSSSSNQRNNLQKYVGLDDLPAMFYQLTLLGKKCDASSNYLRRVLFTIGNALDALLLPLDPGSCSEESSHAMSPVTRLWVSNVSFQRRVEDIFANIVHHLSLILSRDHSLVTEVIYIVRNRWLRPVRKVQMGVAECGSEQPSHLSTGRLLLCVLACQSSQHRYRILGQLLEFICEVFEVSRLGSKSLWFQEQVWQTAMKIYPVDVCRSLGMLLHGFLLVDQTVPPLLLLAFSLVDSVKPNSYYRSKTPAANPSIWSAHDLGAALVIRLFGTTRHLRQHIVKELVSRLLGTVGLSAANRGTASSSAQLHGWIGSSASNTSIMLVSKLCISILMELSRRWPGCLAECVSEVQEIISCIPLLHPDITGTLMDALGPALDLSPALGERCALALRKSSFSKEINCRQAAICALVSLLRFQLNLEQNSTGRIQRSVVLSVDEILSLLKRFLHHQIPVRRFFYNEACELSLEFQSFCPLGIRLLSTHINSFLVGTSDSAAPFYQLEAENCIDANGHFTENLNDLMLSLTTLLAIMPNISSSLETNSHSSCDAFELSQLSQPMTQIPSSSVGVAFNGTAHIESAESLRANRQFWKIIKCASDLSIAEYNLDEEPASVGSISHQYCKAEIISQFFHCCMVHTMIADGADGISGMSAADKVEKLLNLAGKSEQISERMSSFANAIKRKEVEAKKKMKTSGGGRTDADGSNSSVGQWTAAVQCISGNKEEFGWHNWSITSIQAPSGIRKPFHLLICELLFVVRSFELLFNDDVMNSINLPAATSQSHSHLGSQALNSGRLSAVATDDRVPIIFGRPYLHHYFLHSCWQHLQGVIESIGTMEAECEDSFQHAISDFANQPPELSAGSTRQTGAVDKQMRNLQYCSSICQNLFGQLLEDLIRLRKLPDIDLEYIVGGRTQNDPQEGKKRGRSAFSGHSGLADNGIASGWTTPRLLLSCLSQCLKAVATIEGRILELRALLSVTTGVPERAVSLIISEMLNRANSRISGGVSSSSFTQSSEEIIINSCKNFFRLLIDAARTDTSRAWRNESQVILDIIAQLVLLLPNGERSRVAQHIFKDCGTKINSISIALSQALIQFFVLTVPCNPIERLQRAFEIAKLIEACNDEEKRATDEIEGAAEMQNHGTDGADGDGVEATKSFTVVSRETLSVATLTIISIMEKALVEADALLKLKERGSTQQLRLLLKSAVEAGKIDSDDECLEFGNYGFQSMTADEFTQTQPQRPWHDALIAEAGSDMECITIKRIFESAVLLVSSGIVISLVPEKLVSLFTKIYKLQIKLTKTLVQDNCKVLPRMYRVLSDFTANTAHSALQDYITAIHINTAEKLAKQAKVVPELIFQMEQLDVLLIKLCNSVLDKESVRKLIKRSAARDFKLELNRASTE